MFIPDKDMTFVVNNKEVCQYVLYPLFSPEEENSE